MEEDLAPATHSQEQEEREEEPLELVTRRQEPGKMEPHERGAQTIVAYSIVVIIISCVCWKVVFMRESRSILH